MVLLLLVSCQVKIPKEIIQPDKMETVLYDYHMVQAMGSEITSTPEYQLKLYHSYVFDKHGITKALFDSSMVWYTRHPAYLTQIYADLQEQFDHEVAVLQDEKELTQNVKKNSIDENADTLDMWRGKEVLHLTSSPINNRLFLSFESDSAFIEGDSVALALNTRFFAEKDFNAKIHAAILVTYKDGTISSVATDINSSGRYALEVNRDYDKVMKKVEGFVYYTDENESWSSGVVLDGLSLLRIHPEVLETEE